MKSEKALTSVLVPKGGWAEIRALVWMRMCAGACVCLDVCVHVGDCKTVIAAGFDKEMPWT